MIVDRGASGRWASSPLAVTVGVFFRVAFLLLGVFGPKSAFVCYLFRFLGFSVLLRFAPRSHVAAVGSLCSGVEMRVLVLFYVVWCYLAP